MPLFARSSAIPRLSATLTVACTAVLCVAADGSARAQTVACQVGQEVQGEIGGGVKGRIAEIGTTSPHVGWYRLVFAWNSPKGDWYDPISWKVYPVGSTSRCQPLRPPAPLTPAPPSPGSAAAPSKAAAPAPAADQGSHKSNPAPDGLAPGSYACSAGSAGTFTIVIRDGATYVDRAGRAGRFSLSPASADIIFSSGSLAGQYGRLLGPGKFGLSSAPTKTLAVVCNRR